MFSKKEIIPISLIIFAILVSVFLYSSLPDKIPSHWNIKGEVDAWSSKNFTVLFYPSLALGIYLFMTFIPLIDPLRRNYLKFNVAYFWFRTIFVLFFVLLYLYTLWSVLGEALNINYFIMPAISILFIVIGIFIPKIKKNYFVGIRTPWTIHSEEVWNKTHQFGGKFFIAAGLIVLCSLLFPEYSFLIVISVIPIAASIPVIYSYFIFRKIGGFNQEGNHLKGRENN